MNRLLADIRKYWEDRPFVWNEKDEAYGRKIPLPLCGRVLCLGPHPDDPESVAITLRLLMQSGCEILLAIISLSPAGVEEEYARMWSGGELFSLEGKKREIRRREQIFSAGMFGLTQDKVVFLGLEEDSPFDSRENRALLATHLKSVAPDMVIMPMGKDPNPTHSWTYQVFRECAKDLTAHKKKPILALYNEDPKTVEIRKDLYVFFSEESARWKRALLRAHDSQQQRNIRRRGVGFDERILGLNLLRGRDLSASSSAVPYAEVFEIEWFDFPPTPGSL